MGLGLTVTDREKGSENSERWTNTLLCCFFVGFADNKKNIGSHQPYLVILKACQISKAA